jgi:hypothetical protein
MLLHCAGTSHPGYESELIPEYRDVLEWTWTRYVSNSGDKLSPVLSSSILFQQWMLGFDILRHSALVHNLWQMQEWWRSIIDIESSAPHCKEIAGRLLHIIKIDY